MGGAHGEGPLGGEGWDPPRGTRWARRGPKPPSRHQLTDCRGGTQGSRLASLRPRCRAATAPGSASMKSDRIRRIDPTVVSATQTNEKNVWTLLFLDPSYPSLRFLRLRPSRLPGSGPPLQAPSPRTSPRGSKPWRSELTRSIRSWPRPTSGSTSPSVCSARFVTSGGSVARSVVYARFIGSQD